MEYTLAFSTSFLHRTLLPLPSKPSIPYSTAICSATQGKTYSKRFRRKSGRLQHYAASNARQILDVAKGDELIGTVQNVGPADSAWVDVGVASSSGRVVYARLRLPIVKGEPVLSEKEGAIIPVYVLKVAPHSGRMEVRKGLRPPETPDIVPADVRMLDSLRVGEKLDARVIAIGKYGAVLDVDMYRIGRKEKVVKFPGLLKRERFLPTWGSRVDPIQSSKVTKLLSIGDQLTVSVRVIIPKYPLLLLDANEVSPEQVEAERNEKSRQRKNYRRRKGVASVEVGQQHMGIVREVANFGMYIDLGLKRDVLVHYSEMGSTYLKVWKDFIPVGTEVEIEISKSDESGLAAQLISVLQREYEEAAGKSILPMASPADVEMAAAIQSKLIACRKKMKITTPVMEVAEAGLQPTINLQGGGDVDRKSNGNSQGGMRAGNGSKRDYDDDDDDDDDDDEGEEEEEEEEEEEVEQFSDQYFEDRYNF